ncbi:MAG: DUF4830 domain-containing protein [Clostridiales bacterium]|jgi:hypothetical protein|nr:DUF4830 domain-containing protein [Clostridiales bacterium]
MKKLMQWFKVKKKYIVSLFFFVSIALVVLFFYRIDNKTNDMNVSYIQNFGWLVEKKPVDIKYIKVPNNFDVIYDSYNKIQKKIGFDLSNYKGCKLIRYSYKVLNHKETDQDVRANVFIYNKKITCADISSIDFNGFIHEMDDKNKIAQ